MKKIELFWNIVYYGIYRFDVFLRNLLGYLNPFNFINKIKSVQKYHSQYGVDDMSKFRNRILGNRRTGISNIRSGGIIGGLLVLIEYGLFNIIQKIIGSPLIEEIWKDTTHFLVYLIVLLVPVILINNYLLFRKDKYLDYFDEFDKMDERKKVTYHLLSFISVALIVSFFILSFLLL